MNLKKRKGSLLIYSLIGLLILGVSFKLIFISFTELYNAKKEYLTSIDSFLNSEIIILIQDSKDNGTPEEKRDISLSKTFIGQTVDISGYTLKNYSETTTDFQLTFCFPEFKNSTNNICKTVKGTGDLTQ